MSDDITAVGLLRACRPKQWAKNLLVVAAPGAAGVLSEGPVIVDVALAFAAFCLVASGTYLLNDARDLEADRLHPEKRHRPVAAGVVPLGLAVVAGVLLLAAGLAVAYLVSWKFLLVVALYIAVAGSYTIWLKQIPIVDIAAVASGFIIRAIAGGVAADVAISRWFLIVTSFGSLFIVVGKRHGEHLDLGPEGEMVRATLAEYSRDFLRQVWTIASAVTVTAYCLWAFGRPQTDIAPWYELSIVPFVLGILRYALILESGRGSTPEDIVLHDRFLLVMGALWVALLGFAIYLG